MDNIESETQETDKEDEAIVKEDKEETIVKTAEVEPQTTNQESNVKEEEEEESKDSKSEIDGGTASVSIDAQKNASTSSDEKENESVKAVNGGVSDEKRVDESDSYSTIRLVADVSNKTSNDVAIGGNTDASQSPPPSPVVCKLESTAPPGEAATNYDAPSWEATKKQMEEEIRELRKVNEV